MCSSREPSQEHPDFLAGVLYSLKAPGKHREWKHGHILFFCPTLQENSQTCLGEREICNAQWHSAQLSKSVSLLPRVWGHQRCALNIPTVCSQQTHTASMRFKAEIKRMSNSIANQKRQTWVLLSAQPRLFCFN